MKPTKPSKKIQIEQNETLLIGYYSDGGIGSHPAIFSKAELIKLGFIEGLPPRYQYNPLLDAHFIHHWYHKFDELSCFWCTDYVSSIPDGLACAFNSDYLWKIKGISNSLGRKIIKLIGGDSINSMSHKKNLLNYVEKMVELPPSINLEYGVTLITIIPNPTPNTVYWSDEIEKCHSYWQPPYKPISLEEIINDFK